MKIANKIKTANPVEQLFALEIDDTNLPVVRTDWLSWRKRVDQEPETTPHRKTHHE